MQTSNLKTFRWKARNRFGEIQKGKITAQNASALSSFLKEKGFVSIRIFSAYSWKDFCQKIKENTLTENKKKIRANIHLMIRQLSLLLTTHIPLLQALEVISQHLQNLNPRLHKIMIHCQQEIRAGRTLSSAFKYYPAYFNALFCHWVEAGENSGTLDILLDYWVNYQEKNEQVRQKVKKALTYPIFIFVTAFIIGLVLLIGVVPVFEKLFHQFGAELPQSTQIVIQFSAFLKSIGLPLLICLCLIFSILWHIRHRIPQVAYYWDTFFLKMPFLGRILLEAAIARFAHILSVMLSAGFPLSEALKCSTTLMNNQLLTIAVSQLHTAVLSGTPLHQAMSASPFFPVFLKQMVAVGETSGALDKTLSQTALYYEKTLSNTLDNLNQLLEPIIMTILGILTGGFILTMYMPIFKLGSLF